jgi:hypothetical protein
MALSFAPSVPTKRLAASLLSSGTSFSLVDYLSWAGMQDKTTVLVAADFPPIGRGVFRSIDNKKIEFFTFDPATIAGPITILARGLDYKGGVVDGAGVKYDWDPYSTLVELGSNPPAEAEDYVDKTSDQTISGLITFIQNPVGLNPGAAADASTTVKGVTKMSVAPASATSPIAVGQNDPILSTTTASSANNKLITQLDFQKAQETYIASTGSANAYVVTLAPAVAALLEGQTFSFKANFANTGAATLALNGLTAKAITKNGTTALIANDILSGQIITVRYDGTQFQMLSPSGIVVYSSPTAAVVNNTSTTTKTTDTAFTTTFTPKAITIYYSLVGNNSGANTASCSTGVATYDGTTLKGNLAIWESLTYNAGATGNTAAVVAHNPTAGAAGGTYGGTVTLSVLSVSATGFTIRETYAQTGGATLSASYSVVANQ